MYHFFIWRRLNLILSGLEIKKHIGNQIIIEPYDEKHLNPNSYNLRLHNELLVYEYFGNMSRVF